MRILFVITGLGMGGAEHVVVNLADGLVQRGHSVKIVYLTGPATVLPSEKCIDVISLGVTSPQSMLKAYLKLRAIIKQYKPDIIHSHMFHATLLSRLVRVNTNCAKLISTSHSNNEGGITRMILYRLTDRFSDISTNVSSEAAKALISKKAVSSKKMVVIPNGIDISKFTFDPSSREIKRQELNVNNKLMILAVGRFNPAKDYPTLLESISILKKERKDFILCIVGDGPLKDDIIKLAETLDIKKYIKFLGIQRDIPTLMSASDVFVLSSAWEGFGLVVGEAMACERVVVATDCGGVKEVIGNPSNGLLVPPKDSHSLANKLDFALSLNVEEKESFGKKARQHIIDNFSLDANVEAYLKLYNL